MAIFTHGDNMILLPNITAQDEGEGEFRWWRLPGTADFTPIASAPPNFVADMAAYIVRFFARSSLDGDDSLLQIRRQGESEITIRNSSGGHIGRKAVAVDNAFSKAADWLWAIGVQGIRAQTMENRRLWSLSWIKPDIEAEMELYQIYTGFVRPWEGISSMIEDAPYAVPPDDRRFAITRTRPAESSSLMMEITREVAQNCEYNVGQLFGELDQQLGIRPSDVTYEINSNGMIITFPVLDDRESDDEAKNKVARHETDVAIALIELIDEGEDNRITEDLYVENGLNIMKLEIVPIREEEYRSSVGTVPIFNPAARQLQAIIYDRTWQDRYHHIKQSMTQQSAWWNQDSLTRLVYPGNLSIMLDRDANNDVRGDILTYLNSVHHTLTAVYDIPENEIKFNIGERDFSIIWDPRGESLFGWRTDKRFMINTMEANRNDEHGGSENRFNIAITEDLDWLRGEMRELGVLDDDEDGDEEEENEEGENVATVNEGHLRQLNDMISAKLRAYSIQATIYTRGDSLVIDYRGEDVEEYSDIIHITQTISRAYFTNREQELKNEGIKSYTIDGEEGQGSNKIILNMIREEVQ